MVIDLKIAQKIIRVIAVYLPQMNYDLNDFMDIFTDITVKISDLGLARDIYTSDIYEIKG